MAHGKKIVAAGVALGLAGLISWVGCSGEDPAPRPTAHLEAVPLDLSASYDPLAGLDQAARGAAVGGPEGATAYFRVVATHMARAMNNPEVQQILRASVPTWDVGEVSVSRIARQHPVLLGALSAGLRESLEAEGLPHELSASALRSSSDERALLQVVEALFDLEVILVTPPGQSWESGAIPVFYDPIHSGAETIHGVGPDLSPVSLATDILEAPRPFLVINFDEDASWDLVQEATSSLPPSLPQPLERLWNFSLVSSAYADRPDGHSEC